jgi:hypothetical protein
MQIWDYRTRLTSSQYSLAFFPSFFVSLHSTKPESSLADPGSPFPIKLFPRPQVPGRPHGHTLATTCSVWLHSVDLNPLPPMRCFQELLCEHKSRWPVHHTLSLLVKGVFWSHFHAVTVVWVSFWQELKNMIHGESTDQGVMASNIFPVSFPVIFPESPGAVQSLLSCLSRTVNGLRFYPTYRLTS